MSQAGQGQGAEALVGQLIAGYRLGAVLGTGLTGAVYLAQREPAGSGGDDLPEQAAVKVLMPPWQASPAERDEFRERFLREAQTLETLRHPHIVPVLRHGRDEASGGVLYMLMPYLPGGTLAQWLAQAPALLPLERVGSLLAQLADALDYAHSRGVIHRDVKPANVLLEAQGIDGQGAVALTDFSVARLLQDGRGTQTTTGKVLGTFHYMAPEQARGEHVTAAADQYSLGVLAYLLVTGRVPFDADSLVALALQHVQQEVPLPRIARPDLPQAAEAALLRALAKQPSARFPTAGSFARAFAAGLQGQWTEGLAPGQDYFGGAGMGIGGTAGQMPTVQGYTPLQTVMAPPSRRARRQAALAGATLLTLLVLVGLLALLAKGGFTAIVSAPTPTGPAATNGGPPAQTPGTSGTQTATTGRGTPKPGQTPLGPSGTQPPTPPATTPPTPVPTTVTPQLDIHYTHGQVTQADGLVTTTATCSAGELLLSGGAKVDGTLYSDYPSSSNAWTAEGSGSYVGQGVDAWAVCLTGDNQMSTNIVISSSVAISSGGDARVSCPSGSLMVGGGYRITPPPASLFGPGGAFTVIVVGSTPMAGQNGWDVFAYGDSSEQLQTYAVCSQNGFATDAIFTSSASVPPSGNANIVYSCPGNQLLTSGGGADVTMTSSQSMSLEGSLPLSGGSQWDYRAYNYEDSTQSHQGQVYVVCAGF